MKDRATTNATLLIEVILKEHHHHHHHTCPLTKSKAHDRLLSIN
jgi:hypothetical protein